MRISLSKIASEIAKSLSLKHNKKIAYKLITENGCHMMVALCVEPDPYSSLNFSVHYFIQALYRPSSHIILSLGDQIGEWEKKNLTEVLSTILKYYEQLHCNSIATVIDKVINYQILYFGGLENRLEFLAYSYLVIGKYDEARDYLKKIVDFEKENNSDWIIDMVKRAKMLLDMMNQNKRSEIKATLLEWQKYTMSELKLPEL